MNPLAIRIAADLKAFKANMAEMRVQLETNAAAMKRMSSSFDGRKVIGDANAMVKSIHDIGGASKLTESEMRRVNGTVTEALAKYKALGREAPPELLALRDATMKADKPMRDLGDSSTSLMGKLKGLAGTLGIAFGGAAVVSGIKSLISNTFEYAETIKDTSAKLAISMEATQRWKFAAEQTGASLENVSKSVLKLSQGLAGGDKALKEALASAGLELEAIRAMNPEEAFNATADAIARIEDPMLQADVALAAFGKSGADLLPAIRDGFVDIGREVKVMSDETINALDRAKDKWEEFANKITVITGGALGKILGMFEKIAPAMQKIFALMGDTEAAEMWGNFIKGADAANTSINAIADSSKRWIVESKKAGDSNAEIAKSLGVSERAVAAYLKSLEKVPPAINNTGNSLERAAKEADKFKMSLPGVTDAANAKLFFDTLRVGADNFTMSLPGITGSVQEFLASVRVGTDAIESNMMRLPGIADQSAAGFVDALEARNDDIRSTATRWGQGFVSFLGDALSGIGASIVRAIEGGGNVVLAAIGTLAQNAGQHFAAKFAEEAKNSSGKISAGMGAIAGGIVGAWVGVMSYLISDSMKPLFTALELLEREFDLTSAQIEARLRGMGAAGVKAFEDMTRAGLSFANMRDRIFGMNTAKDMLGILDQFQTKEELATIEAQWKAAYDYMLASGLYTSAQLADAWKRYEDAQRAAIGAVDPNDSRPVGARGFPTRAQLQQAASDAKAAYDYMLASGLYTEDVLTQAWDSWADAAAAAGDKTLQNIKKLNDEIISLQEAIAEELPEYDENNVRIYGVIEQQNIDRLAALEAEKAALNLQQIAKELHATEVAAAAADLMAQKEFDAAKGRAIHLDADLRRIFAVGYTAPITFTFPGGIPGGGGGGVPPGSSPSSHGGPLPPPRQGTSSSPTTITVVTQLDGQVVAQNQVKYIPRELSFIGARR